MEHFDTKANNKAVLLVQHYPSDETMLVQFEFIFVCSSYAEIKADGPS